MLTQSHTQTIWSRLARYARSGLRLTVKEFCQQESVSQNAFYVWKRRLPAPEAMARAECNPGAFMDLGMLALAA